MVKQEGVAAFLDVTSKNSIEDLEEALRWNYTFHYDYISAEQDLIYLNIRFNVKLGSLPDKHAGTLDLFEALTQFDSSYQTIIKDIEKGDSNSLIALQSFAWMAQQVGNAWSDWFNVQTVKESFAAHELDFVIQEFRGDGAQEGNLMVTVRSSVSNPTGTQIPMVEIHGFKTCVYQPSQETVLDQETYYFVEVIDDIETPLPYADRKTLSQRIVKITDCNILKDENIWAGISIHRNEVLTGKSTNKDFRYVTPYIRFVEPCLPSLYNETAINLAHYTPNVTKNNQVKLETFLLNFFTVLFTDIVDPVVVMQLKCGYTYPLQLEGGVNFIPLGPTLPILLTTPVSANREILPALLEDISGSVKNWMDNHDVQGVAETGQLKLVLSLYSSRTDDIHNPILKLNGLYLDTNLIDFS